MMTGDPTIDSLSLVAAQATVGNNLMLTANNVQDSGANVTSVAFYRDANSDGILQIGSDQLLGTATSSSGNSWSLSVSTATFGSGPQNYFAVAQDDSGATSPTVSALGFSTTANPLSDASFEMPVQTGGSSAYTYDPSGTPWTFAGGSGVQANGSAWGAANALEGSQTAFLQSNSSGTSISQAVTLSAGTYTIQFSSAQRSFGAGSQPLAISVDGTQIGAAITPSSTNFGHYTTASFSVAAGVHTISFATTDNNDGDRSSFLDNVSIAAIPQNSLVDPGFEMAAQAGGSGAYTYQPTGAGWTFTGGSGIQADGSAWGAASAPEGSQTAFLQASSGGTSISQSVNLSPGTYAIQFDAAQRGYGNGPQPLAITVDGSQVGAVITPVSTSFAQYTTASFTITGSTHTISFSTTDNNDGDCSSFLDSVSIITPGPIVNSGFETPVQTGGSGAYTYGPVGAGWTFNGGAGVQANGSAWGAANAPEGSQTAFLQGSNSGSTISQTANLSAGTYVIQFDAAQRSYGNGTQPLAVSVDGTQVGTAITPASTSFAQFTSTSFTVTAGTHTISFATTDNNDGDRSSLLDNVSITTAGPLVNPGFETPAQTGGSSAYTYVPVGAGWTFNGGAGVQANASAWGAANAPEGSQTAFLQSNPSSTSISQAVNVSAGTYTVQFMAAQRSNGNGPQPLAFSVDGMQIGSAITPGSTSFAQYTTASFTVSAGIHTISFATTDNNSGDRSSFLDDVSFTALNLVGPPSLSISGSARATVGTPYALNLSATETDGDTITGWTVNWGDGTAPQTITGNPASVSYTYGSGVNAGPNVYTVTATATDQHGTYSAATAVVVSVDPAPVLVSAAGMNSVEAGAIYTLSFNTDDSVPLSGWTVSWGDGQTSSLSPNALSASHAYANQGSTTNYTINATATDVNGSYTSNPVVTAVSPSSGPTTLTIAGNTTAVEESPYTLSLSQTAGQAITSWTINWGNGTTTNVNGSATSAQYTYGTAATLGTANYTVTATGTNSHGTFNASNSVAVAVSPAAPTVTISGGSSVEGGQVYILNLSAGNADGDSVVSGWAIHWGDGTTDTLTGSPSSITHVYASPVSSTNYNITATATDETGTYSSNNQAVTVTTATTALSISGSSSAVEGTAYTLNLTQTLGPAVTGWTINWGDGNTTTANASATSAQYAYTGIGLSGASYKITAIGVNSSGNYQSNAVSLSVTAASPTITISGPTAIDGGGIYTVNLSAVEFQGHTVSQWDVQWGDGSPDTVVPGGTSSVSHVFLNPPSAASDTIRATATDDTGSHQSNSLPVTVNPASTVLSISGSSQIGAGATYSLNLSQSGSPTLSGWTINWGDGTSSTVAGTATAAQHSFSKGPAAGSATYQISATGTNSNGTYVSNTVSVAVNPVAPTVTISGPATIEGTATYSLLLSAVETDGDQLSGWSVNWGDGSVSTLPGNVTTASHVYASPSSTTAYTIHAAATDQDGTYSSNSQAVTVNPAITQISIAGANTTTEGNTYTLTLSQSQGPAVTSWTVNWGDGTTGTVSGSTTTAAHVYSKNPGGGTANYSITATATNSGGTYAASGSVPVAVAPATPTFGLSGPNTVAEGNTYTLSLSATEPGGQAVTSWTINWGDGTSSTLQGNPNSATHVFVTSPVGQATDYVMSASATDPNGSHAAGSLTVAVSPASPVFSISGASTAAAGDHYTLDLARVSGTSAVSWTINWGDGSSTSILGSQTVADHAYAEGASTTYTISATVSTSQTSVSAGSMQVTVSPQDPLATIAGDPSVGDNAPYTLTLAAYPPAGDSIQSWTIHWGDGSSPQTVGGSSTSVTHTFPIGANSYAVTATAADLFGSAWDAGAVAVDVTDNGPAATAVQQTPVTINEDAVDQAVLDLTTLFQDLEYPLSQLTYSVVNNFDSSTLASATVNSNHRLVVSGVANTYGMSEVTVEATDPLGEVAYTFVPVIVAPVNQAPTIVASIPGQTVSSGTQPTLVDLWNYFSDREDGPYLTYAIASDSNPGLFSTAPSVDSNGFLNLESFQTSGTAALTITGTDRGGLSVTSASFIVTAAAPAPTIGFTDAASTTKGASDHGWFILQRTGGGDLSQPLTVQYQTSGATAGVDYSALSGSVTFAANSTTAEVDVSALTTNTNDASLTMTITGNGSAYSTGAYDSIHIRGGSGSTPTVLVDASHNGDNTGRNPGWIRIDRTEQNIGSSITMYYTFSGNLLIGGSPPPASGTYGTVSFSSGQGHATLQLTDPQGQTAADTGTLTIAPDQNPIHGSTGSFSTGSGSTPHYYVGNPDVASVTISNEDDSVAMSLAFNTPGDDIDRTTDATFYDNTSFDYGNVAQTTVTVDGISAAILQRIANDEPDRGLTLRIPNEPPDVDSDLEAGVLTLSSPNNNAPITGVLSCDVPDGLTVWIQMRNGQAIDRWVQVADQTINFSSTDTISFYVEGMAALDPLLRWRFAGNGQFSNINSSCSGNLTALAAVPVTLDVATVQHGISTGVLTGLAKIETGAFVPIHYNDFSQDGFGNTAPTASDLLPFTVAPSTRQGGVYTITIPANVSVWSDKGMTQSIQSGQSIIVNHTYWIAGTTEGVGKLSANWINGQVTWTDTVKITTFTITGPRDVPSYTQYAYGVTGALPASGTFLSPSAQGQAAAGSGKKLDQTDFWNTEGPAVERVAFQATSAYVWDFPVNVVRVAVETPDNAFIPGRVGVVGADFVPTASPHLAGVGLVGINSNAQLVAGDQPFGLLWKAQVTMEGNGLRHIRAGFTQVVTSFTAKASYGPGKVLTAILPEQPPKRDSVRPGTSAWYNPANLLTGRSGPLTDNDSPKVVVPFFFNKAIPPDPGDAPIVAVKYSMNFNLYVAAQTDEATNTISSEYQVGWGFKLGTRVTIQGGKITGDSVKVTAPSQEVGWTRVATVRTFNAEGKSFNQILDDIDYP